MRVCGVELAGNDANIALMNLENGLIQLPDCRTRKLSLQKTATAHEDVRHNPPCSQPLTTSANIKKGSNIWAK